MDQGHPKIPGYLFRVRVYRFLAEAAIEQRMSKTARVDQTVAPRIEVAAKSASGLPSSSEGNFDQSQIT